MCHYQDKHSSQKVFIDPQETNTTLTSSHLLEDISQFLIVVNVVLLTVLPRCKALLLLLHIHLPNKQEVGRLHHPQLAAGSHQSPQPFYYLGFLPLEETGAEYEQTKLLALLQDAGQLVCTGHAGTRWHVPCDFTLLGGVRQHLERREWRRW